MEEQMNLLEKIEKAKEIIQKALNSHGNKLIIGCSFGKDSMVLLHLCRQIDTNIKVFSIMANTEFPETYQFAEKIVEEWNLNYKEYKFNQQEGFLKRRELCCSKPKIKATMEAVKDIDGWIAGIRNNEGVKRKTFKYEEKDKFLIKYNPLLEFTEMDIWRYIALFNVPVNPKYKEGYRSLGCKYCSEKEEDTKEEERTGRWKGTIKEGGECGIHTTQLK